MFNSSSLKAQIVLLILIILASLTSLATEEKGTDFKFEDLLIKGKYHFSDEAIATVEDDKILDSLLGVRKDFNDRIKKSTSRH